MNKYYSMKLYKLMPGEKERFPLSEALGPDPVTLFEWAKKRIKRTYKDCTISFHITNIDKDTGTVFYSWLVIYKDSPYNRNILVAELNNVEYVV